MKVVRIRDTRTVVGARGQLLRGGAVSVFKFRRDVLKEQGQYPDDDYALSPAYWDRMKANGLNAVRLVWFGPSQRSHGDPGSKRPYPHADLNNPSDVAEMLSDFDTIIDRASQRNMYDISDLPHLQKPVRDLAKYFPVINTEQNFPASVDDGVDDPDARGYGSEQMGTQSMERLSISWFHWNIAGPGEMPSFENFVLPDADAKGYSWLAELQSIDRFCTACQWMELDQKVGEVFFPAVKAMIGH